MHHIVLKPLRPPPPTLAHQVSVFSPDTSLHGVWSWARRATSFSPASGAATVFACSAAGWARGATIFSKHGVHEGSTGASRENTPRGLHSRVAPNVYQEPNHGPVKRSLRSMVPTMALHERVVNTLLGLHSRVAPNVYQEPYDGPVERSLRSMVPTMALHERVVDPNVYQEPYHGPVKRSF